MWNKVEGSWEQLWKGVGVVATVEERTIATE
jgi:hypothetical protein